MSQSYAEQLIERLGMQPHPEGGWYVERYRSEQTVTTHDGRERPALTTIMFLLQKGQYSAWHQVRSDEVWDFYDGEGVTVYELTLDGQLHAHRLGRRLLEDESPQVVIKGDSFQATAIDGEWALVGCTVGPGFVFDDFTLNTREQMLPRFDQHRDTVLRFLKDGK